MSTINFGSKQCERIRGQLDAYLSNELLVETTGEVAKHLASCAACSRELESLMRVRDALRDAVGKKLPPEHLSAAVRARIKSARPAFFPFLQAAPAWAIALASIAFVILAGVAGQQWLKVRSGRQMIAAVLTLGVSDHLHCAIRAHNYPEVAHLPDELSKKLGPRYAGLLPVVEAKLPGFQILEAHICSVPGSPRKYVHFIARGRGTILSVILTRRAGESLPAGRFLVASTSGGVDLYDATLEGMGVVGFETTDYLGFVVSDLGRDEMVQLTSPLVPPLCDALNARTESGALPPPQSLSS
ncbi:MAG TPA: zf-HC2 domain-containing protein [Acidobacteriota bacterium]|nr:zf-HC2 domain-containing protein [Acidobacteriota bacterium]